MTTQFWQDLANQINNEMCLDAFKRAIDVDDEWNDIRSDIESSPQEDQEGSDELH